MRCAGFPQHTILSFKRYAPFTLNPRFIRKFLKPCLAAFRCWVGRVCIVRVHCVIIHRVCVVRIRCVIIRRIYNILWINSIVILFTLSLIIAAVELSLRRQLTKV